LQVSDCFDYIHIVAKLLPIMSYEESQLNAIKNRDIQTFRLLLERFPNRINDPLEDKVRN
jgi:hypothetical protein